VSDGRLELGIGSGYQFDEFRGLNVFPEDSRPMFMEVLEILLKAWTGEPFSYKEKYYAVPEGIAVRPTAAVVPYAQSQDHRMGGEDGLAPDDCHYRSVIGQWRELKPPLAGLPAVWRGGHFGRHDLPAASTSPQGPLLPGEGFSFKDYFETHAIMETPQFCVDKNRGLVAAASLHPSDLHVQFWAATRSTSR
jgi:Luciferase-like monooxygenase